MDNAKNFYISAIVAFGSYFLLISMAFVYLSLNDVKKFDSFSKETVLELDIVLSDISAKNIKKAQVSRKNSKVSKDVVNKSTSVSAKQKSDLKSLFANIKTEAHAVKKETTNNVVKSLTTSRFKSKFDKQTKSDNDVLSKFLNNQKSQVTKQKTGDAKNENDPYISRIYEILHSRWKPLIITDNLSTKVIVTIYDNGRFAYNIIQYSGDNTFDNQLILFLEEQKNIIFPLPNKSKIKIEVIFTAKG
ncbi:TonB-like; putative TolA function [hydrothermal vent metagenome]|uniref:TonB-like putative TolA function n=1 Tax=hydrothermal vent metagenome TaxID=652676 RepID=A0A3B1DWE0_9ZZZZ